MTFFNKFVQFIKITTLPIVWWLAKKIYLNLKRYHGQWKMDKIIEGYLDYDGGYYVELDAVDGIGLSNTLYFELKRNWTGLLIESSPNNYLKCVENRSKRNAIVCAACTSFDYRQNSLKWFTHIT